MKQQQLITTLKYFFFLSLFSFLGCNQFSEIEVDPSAGDNGSFEVSKNGIPVNWLMYTPNTVPAGEFEIILDKVEFKEGAQSLKFKVEECSSKGGWYSPGFTNQFDVDKESVQHLSFWVKNQGAEFKIMAGGVSAMTGDMKTLIQSSEEINDWKYYEFSVPISSEFDQLRLEVNILKPGVFWIDDLQIAKEY